MSEIEKMYENAEVMIQDCLCGYHCVFDKSNKNCIVNEKCKTKDCAYLDDNSFTAEKQLELIKWLATKDYRNFANKLLISTNEGYTCFSVGISTDYGSECLYEENAFCSKLFEQALAGLINNLWQDLTEEEKQQVKEILE